MYWTPQIKNFRKVLASLLAAYRLKAAERSLQVLDDYMLKDIGLHRSEIGSILREAAGNGATPCERRIRSAAKAAPACAVTGPQPAPVA